MNRGYQAASRGAHHARYYDPVIGQFLSADTVQGNAMGMDPYGYVGGNPETKTDPTGHRDWGGGDEGTGGGGAVTPGAPQPGGGNSGRGSTKSDSGAGGACGKLTAPVCSQAQVKLNQRTDGLTRTIKIISIVGSLVTLVADAFPFVGDLLSLHEGFSLKKLLATIGDGIPVFLDLAAVLAALAALTGWQNLTTIADGVTAIANALSAAYKVVKGILENKWLSALADAGGWILEGLTTLFTGGGTEVLMVAVGAAFGGIWDKMKNSISAAVVTTIGANGLTAWAAHSQAQLDYCNSLSLEQYYYHSC